MARLFAAYNQALTSHPILTKTVTSMVLFAGGDVMAQRFERPEALSNLDATRVARQAVWGALFTPLAHVWYLNLDRWVPGLGASVLVRKVLLDQLTWTVRAARFSYECDASRCCVFYGLPRPPPPHPPSSDSRSPLSTSSFSAR